MTEPVQYSDDSKTCSEEKLCSTPSSLLNACNSPEMRKIYFGVAITSTETPKAFIDWAVSIDRRNFPC